MGVKELFDIGGRVALVTGGSRGLGLQMAEALGEMGARVVVVARRRDELDAAAARLRAMGMDALPLVCDLSQADAIAPLVEQAIVEFGPIDILINNAGATWGAPTVVHLTPAAMFLLCQELGRRSLVPRRRGKLMNVASLRGLGGGADEGR